MLPRQLRLTKNQEYQQLYTAGRKSISPYYRLFFVHSRHHRPARFGIVVSKREAAKIAKRNRLKRLIRDELRRALPQISPGSDVVVQVRKNALTLSDQKLRAELIKIIMQAKLFRP